MPAYKNTDYYSKTTHCPSRVPRSAKPSKINLRIAKYRGAGIALDHPGVLYFSYLNILSRSSWQIGLRPFAVRTLIAASLSATRKIMQALFALLARKA